jgi:hypothetical protein
MTARDFESPEALTERDLALVVERRPADDEHGVLFERGADLRPRGVVDRTRDVDATDLGGEGVGQWRDRYRHWRGWLLRRMPMLGQYIHSTHRAKQTGRRRAIGCPPSPPTVGDAAV